MGWVRLDDNFADHPKVIALSDTAFRLFITGLCYANRQLTDGLIPYQMVMAWVGDNPFKPSDELEDQNLWERVDKGFRIRSYDEYQPTRNEVESKRQLAKDRLARYRERNANETQMKRVSNAYQQETGNANETPVPTQPNPTQPKSLDISKDISKEVALPRVHSARNAVENISNKMTEARNSGINAWNLTNLVSEQWDELHNANDIGGCIALTAWYVAELQSRNLTSAEIGRIGQMTKRFGRIALLAIDEAASKDLTDLVSYAFRIAQRMYADVKSKS
jgi:hypothetical protein